MNTSTATIKLDGTAQTVELRHNIHRDTGVAHNATTERVFACRIGNGQKLHRTGLVLFPYDSEADARAKGYRRVVTDSDGQVWAYDLSTVVRNRQARVVTWASDVDQATATAQTYYGSI